MSELDEILTYLEYISQQRRIVSLVNTYQGVSISLDVDIFQVARRRGEISVTTRQGQNISLLPATKILIHSDLFPKPIQATVASVDVHHRSAVLKNLLYPQSLREGRKETRVQPREELKAKVAYGAQNELVARVRDISVGGISLLIKEKSTGLMHALAPKESVRLNFVLPISGKLDPVEMSFPATVTYVNQADQSDGMRVGFMTLPNEDDKSILRRYIFDRQTQLFSEVQDLSMKKGPTLIS
jgi:hypothetical protein